MSEEVWKGHFNYWDSPEFKAKAERNKRSRASDCGGLGSSLHTCGSIPFTQARRRLAKILGRVPTIDEIFLFTHMKKEPGEISGSKFVEKRSEDAYIQGRLQRKQRKLCQEIGEVLVSGGAVLMEPNGNCQKRRVNQYKILIARSTIPFHIVLISALSLMVGFFFVLLLQCRGCMEPLLPIATAQKAVSIRLLT